MSRMSLSSFSLSLSHYPHPHRDHQFYLVVLTTWEDVVPQTRFLNPIGGDRTQAWSHQTDGLSQAPQSKLCPSAVGHGHFPPDP